MKTKNIIFITIILIVLMTFNYIMLNIYFDSWELRGQVGDSFGAISALFGGLAFAGLIYTIYLQRNELQLQREELKLQREEMAKSREQLSKQVTFLKAQYNADIAKIRTSALEAEIEAIKMEKSLGVSGPHIKNIRDVKTSLSDLADHLDNSIK